MVPQEESSNELEQIIIAYSQLTGQNPAEIVQQLQQLDDSQLEQAISQMVGELQQSQGDHNKLMINLMTREQKGTVEYAQAGLKVGDFKKIIDSYTWDPTYEKR